MHSVADLVPQQPVLPLHRAQLHYPLRLHVTLQPSHPLPHALLRPPAHAQVQIFHLRKQVLVLELQLSLDELVRHKKFGLFSFLELALELPVLFVPLSVESAETAKRRERFHIFWPTSHLLHPSVVDHHIWYTRIAHDRRSLGTKQARRGNRSEHCMRKLFWLLRKSDGGFEGQLRESKVGVGLQNGR
jgi:hypothetical protein